MNFLFKEGGEESKGQLGKPGLLHKHAWVTQMGLFQGVTAVDAKTPKPIPSMKSNDE